VLVFTLELNISQTIKLNCLLILVLSIGLWFIRRKQQNRHNIETFAKIPYTGIVTFGGVLFLTFILYRFLPSGFMVEELIVLRKIFESDAITMRGMAYMPAEATTYIFFPFYLLVAMISRAVSVDVVIGVSMMRGFTGAIYMLSLAQISYLVSKSKYPGIIIFFATLIHAIFFIHSRPDSDILTIFIPPADRIGFSVCLMALALFHFIVHMQDKKTNIGMFIGLIYLIIEIAFVHANEAILIIICVFLFLFLLLLQRPLDIQKVKRCVAIIIICLLVLVCYKYINLFVNQNLHLYVAEMKELARDKLIQKMNTVGLLQAFSFSPSPYPLENEIGMWAYNASLYILPQLKNTPGTRFIFPVLLLLPFISYFARNVYELFFPFLIIILMLIYMSDGIRLLMIMLIGSYHFFSAFMNAISIALIIIIAVNINRFSNFLMYYFSNPTLYRRYHLFVLLPVPALICRLLFIENFQTLTGFFYGDLTVYIVSMLIVIFKCFRINSLDGVSIIKQPAQFHSNNIVLSLIIVFILSASIAETYMFTKSSKSRGIEEILSYEYHPASFTGDTISDLQRLAQQGILNLTNIKQVKLDADPEAIRFIHNNLPVRQIWWSISSVSILVYLNQYAPFLAENGWLSRGWESNIAFIADNYGINMKSDAIRIQSLSSFALHDISRITEQTIRNSLFTVFEKYKIRYILAPEIEYASVIDALQENPEFAQRLRTIFDNGKSLIFEVISENK